LSLSQATEICDSLGRRGSALDNAVIEAIEDENTTRQRSALGLLSPLAYEHVPGGRAGQRLRSGGYMAATKKRGQARSAQITSVHAFRGPAHEILMRQVVMCSLDSLAAAAQAREGGYHKLAVEAA
jgi:hypothetical protein